MSNVFIPTFPACSHDPVMLIVIWKRKVNIIRQWGENMWKSPTRGIPGYFASDFYFSAFFQMIFSHCQYCIYGVIEEKFGWPGIFIFQKHFWWHTKQNFGSITQANALAHQKFGHTGKIWQQLKIILMHFFAPGLLLTCISQELVFVIDNDSCFWIIETISTIVATFRNVSRWDSIC
jgi:hypothetical protein